MNTYKKNAPDREGRVERSPLGDLAVRPSLPRDRPVRLIQKQFETIRILGVRARRAERVEVLFKFGSWRGCVECHEVRIAVRA